MIAYVGLECFNVGVSKCDGVLTCGTEFTRDLSSMDENSRGAFSTGVVH